MTDRTNDDTTDPSDDRVDDESSTGSSDETTGESSIESSDETAGESGSGAGDDEADSDVDDADSDVEHDVYEDPRDETADDVDASHESVDSTGAASEGVDSTGESSGLESDDVPQYFDPVAETSDELPASDESSRSETIGIESNAEHPPLAEQEDIGEATTHAGLERARKMGKLLDTAIEIPGTRFRVGLDPLLGILPGGGDLAAAVGSLYIVLEAARANVPRNALVKMLALVAIDLVVGSIPILGVVFDAFWKANQWNVDTFEQHVENEML